MNVHEQLSHVKSIIRIAGFIVLGGGNLVAAAIVLGVAEVVGILEEVLGA